MTVAAFAPVVKVVVVARTVNIRVESVRARELAALPGTNGIGLATAGGFAFAVAHHHECRVAIFAGLNAVLAGAQNGKRLVRRVHFKNFVAVKPLHANAERSFRELDLHGTIVQVEERKASVAVQADGR